MSLTTQEKIVMVGDSIKNLLLQKNKKYGDSAINPIGIFNKENAANSIKIRLDDKISRIKNSSELRKNDVADIIGYLHLLCIANDWLDFNDLID